MKASAAKICNDLNHTKISFNQKKQLLLPWCCWWFFIESTKYWMGEMMLDVIEKMMNGSYEAWSWVQQEYIMNRIIHKFHPIKNKTALTLLSPTIFDWINKRMDESDALWRRVHQKYVMSQIIWNLLSLIMQ